MIVRVLASGSKGNSTLIETNKSKILIDVGLCISDLENRLCDVKLDQIDAIFITHTHSDHIKGLAQIKKHHKIPIYDNLNIEESLNIKDLTVSTITLSHDVDCFGLIVSDNIHELVYITDTGYISSKNIEITKNKDIYIIESNHDEKMLLEGSYPYILKQRIISDRGHLSNKASSQYIKKVIGDKTKYVVLAHLSEENNRPEIAYQNMEKVLKDKDIKLLVAKQHEVTEEIMV
jgi:phosphoribosyl 1,2-cyclic phosphodiesterase